MNQKNIILAIAAGLIGWAFYPEKSPEEDEKISKDFVDKSMGLDEEIEKSE